MRWVAGRVWGRTRAWALPSRPSAHMAINATPLEGHQVRLVAVARVSEHDIGLGPEGLLHLIEQRQHPALVRGLWTDLRCGNDLVLRVHRRLCVVTLLEPLGAWSS